MQAELRAYQAGETTFDAFARATHKTWLALATYLLGRWKAPPGVSVEDLQQELLVACWRCVPKFDPARGVALHSYVVYNCCDKAKKWLHKQRNAYRRDDKSPSRFPVSLAALGLEPHAEDRLLSVLASEGMQEQQMIRRQTLQSVESDDLAFLLYRRAASLEAAAEAIQASSVASFILRTSSVAEARAVVERSIERAAMAVATAAA